MNQQKSLLRIIELFSKLSTHIANSNAAGFLDGNRIAEDILRPVLSVVYRLDDLINLNSVEPNFPGVDLGDEKARVAFQITSNTNSKKIKDTLQKIVSHKHYEKYDKFFVYDLTGKQKTYGEKSWKKIIDGNFDFTPRNVIDSDSLLKKIPHLELAEILEIETILGTHLGDLRVSLKDLQFALKTVSETSIIEALHSRKPIVRKGFREQISEFINSTIRYAFVTGASAVGKSTAMAIEARRLIENDENVLLLPFLPGEGFSLEYVSTQIKEQLPERVDKLEWTKIVDYWKSVGSENEGRSDVSKLIVIFDSLEVTEPKHIATQLNLLHRSLLLTPQARVKVIISCRDTQLEGFLNQKLFPFYNPAANPESNSLLDFLKFEIRNFTTSELDAALREIGAAGLLSETDRTGQPNLHVKALRSILKHPGTFEHYAALFALGEIKAIQEETWSGLIEKRLERTLQEVVRTTAVPGETIKAGLISFVKYCREKKKRDFTLDIDETGKLLPEWFEQPQNNTYSNLVRSGILEERSGPQSRKVVSFGITDAGAYLLSFVLEDDFTKAPESNREELVSSWLQEGWSYWPVKDAALALIDRLTDSPEPKRRQLLPLLEVLISNRHNNDFFQLMKPSVLEFIFKLIKKKEDKEDVYYGEYFEAAKNVRYSTQNNELIERNFTDLHSQARELAVRLTGDHQITSFVPSLLNLLSDENRDVRTAVVKSCGKIGVPAVNAIINFLDNEDLSDEIKSRAVWAIINIGYLDNRVSECLSRQFEQALGSQDLDLLENLLLASAVLRDRNQVQFALKALKKGDGEILRYVGKFFTEVPDNRAFDELKNILKKIDPTDFARSVAFTQFVAALLKIDRGKALAVIEPLLKRSLREDSNLKPSGAAELIQKHNFTECYGSILENIIKHLKKSPAALNINSLNEILDKTSHPDSLENLASACNDLTERGVNVARLYVDTILPENHDDEDYIGRLNQVEHLRPLIKGKVSNFADEAVRLLPKAPRFSTRELSLYFWVLGDTSVESALLDKLNRIERPADRADELSYEENGILRALGTCGTENGVAYILAMMAERPDGVTINFPQETLLPLLIRKTILTTSLAGFIANEKNHEIGRALCIESLARYEPQKHRELFETVTKNTEDGILLRRAVIALGATRSPKVVRPLRELLRRKVGGEIKGYAARALSVLDAKEAVADIEEAFSDLSSYGDEITVKLFVEALTRLGQQSSIKILRMLESAPREIAQYFSEALAGLSSNPKDEVEIKEKLEESFDQPRGFFDSQSYLIKGLLKRSQNEHLNLVSEHLENGRLSTNSRWQIRRFLRSLAVDPKIDQSLLTRIVAKLICDPSPVLRYNTLSGLSFLDPKFCQNIYDFIITSPISDEWARSCATESLGYWESDRALLLNSRFDSHWLVRNAADMALENRDKRVMLQFHRSVLLKSEGMDRLCSFLCILENGDMEIARYLSEDSHEVGPPALRHIFSNHLSNKIFDRLQSKESDLQRAQEKRLNDRLVISFD